MKRITAVLLLAAAVLSLPGCSRIGVKKPEGFAENREAGMYRAISPEGVRYSVRIVKNYPQKDLLFWKDALKNHMLKSGYMLIKEDNFNAGTQPGAYFEWGAPYGNQNYIYLTAIIIRDREIAVAEAAGDVKLVSVYRNSLLESIKTVQLN
jgi:hypothetical protein